MERDNKKYRIIICMMPFIVIWAFFSIIQILFWGFFFHRLGWYRPSYTVSHNNYPVSVIICARNEAANLQNNLELILQQDYLNYEVIVVNDDSTDKTAKILEKFMQKYTHLNVVTIRNKKGVGKKSALAEGIRHATNEWLLLTDADCQPASKWWIQTMQLCIQPKTEIVLGYGPYRTQNTWVNKWVQYETTYVAIQYFSFALWRIPYMGVGRNLMYRKSLYLKNKGFASHEHIMSGDDDLFVNEVANSENTEICIDQSASMYSDAPATWKALYHQKKRHYSSSSHYQLAFKILLGALSLSHMIYYLGAITFLLINVWYIHLLFVIILRTFLVYFVFLKCGTKLHQLKTLRYLWLVDLLLPLYYVLFASALSSKKNKKWK